MPGVTVQIRRTTKRQKGAAGSSFAGLCAAGYTDTDEESAFADDGSWLATRFR